MRPAPADDIGRAIEVLNSWDTQDPDPDQIRDLDVFRRFLRWLGRPEAAEQVKARDLARFRATRSRLRNAIDAGSEEAAVDALNAILDESPSRARLVREGGGWRFRFDGPDDRDPLGFLAPLCAVALLSAIRDLGWQRLGTCAGSPCTCVFVDRTRNRRRRFCSDRCNDRVAQAARRRRAAS